MSIGKNVVLNNPVSCVKHTRRFGVNYPAKLCDMHLSQYRGGMPPYRSLAIGGLLTGWSNGRRHDVPGEQGPGGSRNGNWWHEAGHRVSQGN